MILNPSLIALAEMRTRAHLKEARQDRGAKTGEAKFSISISIEATPAPDVARRDPHVTFRVKYLDSYGDLLSFRGVVDGEERAAAERLGVQLPEAWTSNKYVLVGEG